MTFSAEITMILKKMLRFIEAEIRDNDCDNFLDDCDVIAFVDDDEFDSILIICDRRKLVQ